MSVVVVGGMLAATLVCFLVVRPHGLAAEPSEPAVALAH